MDMTELIIAALVGGFIGWRASRQVHLDGFRQLLRALKVSEQDLLRAMIKIQSPGWQPEDLEEAKDLTVVEITLEQQGNQIFAYRKDDSTFLGQGNDKATLIDAIAHRMKDVRLVISEEDGADLLQKSHT
jgi:hypothetical protein